MQVIDERKGKLIGVSADMLGTLAYQKCAVTTKTIASGHADITLTNTEARAFALSVGGTADAGVNLIVPVGPKLYLFTNSCGRTVTVKTAAGTGIAVATAKYALLYANGTNVIRITADT